MTLPGMIPFGGLTSSAIRSQSRWLGGAVATSPYYTGIETFSNKSLGTPHSSRVIAVAFGGDPNSNPSASSVTVGGVSLTERVVTNYSGVVAMSIWSGVVPSGLTGDIVVTQPVVFDRIGISWAALYVDSAAPQSTASDVYPSGTPDLDLNVSAGDVVFGAFVSDYGGTHSWTGADEKIEQSLGGNYVMSAAFSIATSTETPRTISVSQSSPLRFAGVSAVWR